MIMGGDHRRRRWGVAVAEQEGGDKWGRWSSGEGLGDASTHFFDHQAET